MNMGIQRQQFNGTLSTWSCSFRGIFTLLERGVNGYCMDCSWYHYFKFGLVLFWYLAHKCGAQRLRSQLMIRILVLNRLRQSEGKCVHSSCCTFGFGRESLPGNNFAFGSLASSESRTNFGSRRYSGGKAKYAIKHKPDFYQETLYSAIIDYQCGYATRDSSQSFASLWTNLAESACSPPFVMDKHTLN